MAQPAVSEGQTAIKERPAAHSRGGRRSAPPKELRSDIVDLPITNIIVVPASSQFLPQRQPSALLASSALAAGAAKLPVSFAWCELSSPTTKVTAFQRALRCCVLSSSNVRPPVTPTVAELSGWEARALPRPSEGGDAARKDPQRCAGIGRDPVRAGCVTSLSHSV